MMIRSPKNRKDNSLATDGAEYTDLLVKRQLVWWKRLINVQAPYRWNLRLLNPGHTLDIGCGIGRNLSHLKGRGVGIDSNPYSVRVARSRGFIAFTNEEFESSPHNAEKTFDSILFSHIAEHLGKRESVEVLKKYIMLLKPEGKVIIISPQEAGYRHGPAHIEFIDFMKMRQIAEELNLIVMKEYSFPLPRIFGHLFIGNEFVSVSRLRPTISPLSGP